jgi:hypothetical protein
MAFVEHSSKRLARDIVYQMIRFQQKLESRQAILNRIVDIGVDLFAISASCAYAEALEKEGKSHVLELADLFCKEARQRIEANSRENQGRHNDREHISVAKKLMAQKFEWLEQDIIKG